MEWHHLTLREKTHYNHRAPSLSTALRYRLSWQVYSLPESIDGYSPPR